MKPFYVTEDEEQTLKHQVQTIFFGCTDRLKAKFGTAGRAEVMAMVARGFGQCLRATCVSEGKDPEAEAPKWVDAFFEHLGETGVKVNRKKVKPDPNVLASASGLIKDFRDEEEWFFPRDRTWKLKAWLVASFRVVPTMRPLVPPERACGIFLHHFAAGVAEDLPPAKGPGKQPGPGNPPKGKKTKSKR